MGQVYRCKDQHRGALLSLPYGGSRKDVIDTKVFQNCIKENAEKWFRWSKKRKLAVENIEDLILVSGCTLVTSWALAAFEGRMPADQGDSTTISLETRKFDGVGAEFFWRNGRGRVGYKNSSFNSVRSSCCLHAMDLCFLYVLGCSRTSTSEPMCLYQGPSCKAHFLPDHTSVCCIITWPRALSVNIHNKLPFLYSCKVDGLAALERIAPTHLITRSEPSGGAS